MVEKRRVVSPALLDSLPGGGTDKHGVVPEMPLHLGVAVFALSHGHPVGDLNVLILLIVAHKSVYQNGRFICGMSKKDPCVVGDVLDSLVCGHKLLLINVLPAFHKKSPKRISVAASFQEQICAGRFCLMPENIAKFVPINSRVSDRIRASPAGRMDCAFFNLLLLPKYFRFTGAASVQDKGLTI